eukprot:TRINITY_DN1082_c1_g1_i2.p1 TRINITY_DN1082_c1_g1~~TRINITY_DN1082_c1_g1_i2.p1  ORF type:complete len:205 (-),score=59.49 TRINITY_DN1082_c1_g1_i2:22-636(-)
MAKVSRAGIGIILLNVISIAGLIALVGGASWYSYKITKSNGDLVLTNTFYLTQYTNSNNKTVTYSDIDSQTSKANQALNLFGSSTTVTNCASAGQTALGLTVADLILHAGFLAILALGKGTFSNSNFKHAASAMLFVGMVLLVAAVAYFDSNNKCAKYIYDTDANAVSGLGYTATLTAAAAQVICAVSGFFDLVSIAFVQKNTI